MEKTTITKVTLDEARELYNSHNKTLKELALKCFSENELKLPSFSEIKTFEDAVTVLGMSIDDENSIVNTLKKRSKAMAAMYKLNIIRKALNLGQNIHLIKSANEDSLVYCPKNPFIATYYIISGPFENSVKIWSTLQETIILLAISLALLPAYKMRFWNIGGQGQILMGALMATIVMIYLNFLPNTIVIIIALIGAIIYYFINKKFFKSWTTSNKSEIKQPFTENKNRDYNIDDSQRQEH